MKQRDVTELLARADDLAVQNKSYQEVYAAMAQSLSEAWVDLNKQLDYRKLLLDQSINFHESALQVCGSLSEYLFYPVLGQTYLDLVLHRYIENFIHRMVDQKENNEIEKKKKKYSSLLYCRMHQMQFVGQYQLIC